MSEKLSDKTTQEKGSSLGGLATREVVDGGFRPAPGEVVESLSPPAAECMHHLEKRFPDGDGDKEPLMKECPPALLSEEEAVVPFSMPVLVEEADGNGAIVLKDDWRVQTLDNGTTLELEWNVVLHKACPPLHIPGAEMV